MIRPPASEHSEMRQCEPENDIVVKILNKPPLLSNYYLFSSRKVWEYFLEICHQNNSLFGTTWASLRSQLDRAEVAKNYVLNPLAPEFVPNRLFHITRQAAEAAAAGATGGTFIQQGAAWPSYAGHHHHHPVMQHNPYQVGAALLLGLQFSRR